MTHRTRTIRHEIAELVVEESTQFHIDATVEIEASYEPADAEVGIPNAGWSLVVSSIVSVRYYDADCNKIGDDRNPSAYPFYEVLRIIAELYVDQHAAEIIEQHLTQEAE